MNVSLHMHMVAFKVVDRARRQHLHPDLWKRGNCSGLFPISR